EGWWRFIRRTKNPDLPVVLLEDTAALLGLAIAFAGVVLADVTGNARWDGLGSLAIGVVLVLVAIVLVIETGSLLVGESARPEDVARITAVIDGLEAAIRAAEPRATWIFVEPDIYREPVENTD